MILDTNALSAWAGGDGALLQSLPKDRMWLLPVVVLGEFAFGIRRSRDRVELERWLSEVKNACVVLGIDADTADHYADIREELRTAGNPIPENDVWIAAICRQHNLPLVTRDGHFDQVSRLKRITW